MSSAIPTRPQSTVCARRTSSVNAVLTKPLQEGNCQLFVQWLEDTSSESAALPPQQTANFTNSVSMFWKSQSLYTHCHLCPNTPVLNLTINWFFFFYFRTTSFSFLTTLYDSQHHSSNFLVTENPYSLTTFVDTLSKFFFISALLPSVSWRLYMIHNIIYQTSW
jgi:hypothetical protein